MQTFFSRSPWERSSMVPFRGSMLGQTAPNCEPTPEGGQRCADGTYYPKGCAPGSGAGIPAAAPTPGANVPLIIGGVAAAAAAGYLLLSGQQHRIGDQQQQRYPISYPPGIEPLFSNPVAPETSPETPEASALAAAKSKVESIASKITTERANDAYFFEKYIEASKLRQDMVIAEGKAQDDLAKQEKIWNETHRNPDEYQAAQAHLDLMSTTKSRAAQNMEEYRNGINTAAQNILTYRSNAQAIVSQLPPEVQAEVWRLIDPCSYGAPKMEGRRLGQMYTWNSGGDQSGHGFYNWNTAAQYGYGSGGMTPEQRVLEQSGAADCYICSYGRDIQSGVDAATAASLRAQGYQCQSGILCTPKTDFGSYSNDYAGSSSSMTAVNPGGGGGAMMGRRYPVVNSR